MSYLEMAKAIMQQGNGKAPRSNACNDGRQANPVAMPDAARALHSGAPRTLADNLPADWREAWEERRAIMRYDGKLSAEEADEYALQDIIRQMESRKHN